MATIPNLTLLTLDSPYLHTDRYLLLLKSLYFFIEKENNKASIKTRALNPFALSFQASKFLCGFKYFVSLFQLPVSFRSDFLLPLCTGGLDETGRITTQTVLFPLTIKFTNSLATAWHWELSVPSTSQLTFTWLTSFQNSISTLFLFPPLNLQPYVSAYLLQPTN